MKAKEALDLLFKDVDFNEALGKKLTRVNIGFITRTNDHKHLFGGKTIGSHFLSYTIYDKNLFYDEMFGLEFATVSEAIEKITSINPTFKIARDDINLVTFYMAHRFLSNKKLPAAKAMEYAEEALDYFNYRTLVLITSTYFVYPISEEKAVSLTERLSNRYLIKKLKNWKEYCKYRSKEYLESKFIDVVRRFNKDDELPNAISDLYGRTKDTIKNIYGEFIAMMENDDYMKSRSGTVSDIEGNEVIVDKLGTPDSYFTKLEAYLSDKNSFVRREYINVVVDIINTITFKSVQEVLTLMVDFSYRDSASNVKVKTFLKNILVNAIEYLHSNSIHLHSKSSALEIVNNIVGNVLYARGTEISINELKDEGDRLIKEIYKANGKYITERNIRNNRNAVYIYVVLLTILS